MSLAKVDVDENVEIAMEYLVIKLGYVFIRVILNKKKYVCLELHLEVSRPRREGGIFFYFSNLKFDEFKLGEK